MFSKLNTLFTVLVTVGAVILSAFLLSQAQHLMIFENVKF